MSCAVCSAAYVSKRVLVTPFAWIRGSLLWQRTNAKIFSIPAICCLVMICQPTSPKGRRRITNAPHPVIKPSPRGRGGIKARGYGTDARDLRQYHWWRACLPGYGGVVRAGGPGVVQTLPPVDAGAAGQSWAGCMATAEGHAGTGPGAAKNAA